MFGSVSGSLEIPLLRLVFGWVGSDNDGMLR